MIEGPVEVQAHFVFPRPKSHYHSSKKRQGELRGDAPLWHTSAPDLDKLQRAIGDALAGVVIRDDAQIARWRVSKSYGQTPRAMITVIPLGTIAALRERAS